MPDAERNLKASIARSLLRAVCRRKRRAASSFLR